MGMELRAIFSCIAIAGICAYPGNLYAQFAYEGMRQGIKYKVYIYDKRSLGDAKWDFQTKAVFSSGSKPYFSDQRIADCYNSTIDGKVVRAIPQHGYELGDGAILLAVCGMNR